MSNPITPSRHPALTSHRHARARARGRSSEPHRVCIDPRDPSSLLRDHAGLASPPDVCLRVFELMLSAEASARDFARVIAADPSLTARLLRLVNSSFYGFRRPIDTVAHAVAAVGLQTLYRLVVAVSALRTFVSIPSGLVDMHRFWRHSLHCGLLAQGLAKRRGAAHPECLFVAGLLHDIGCLVLFHRLPHMATRLLALADGDEGALHRHEIEVLGYGHCTVGGLLLRQWRLPDAIARAVESHHERPARGLRDDELGLVRLADILSSRSEEGAMIRPEASPSGVLGEEDVDIAEADAVELLGEVEAELSATLRIFAAAGA